MERATLQLATCARRSGYDVVFVLYDQPYTGSDAEYQIEGIPVAFVPRTSGIDFTLPFRLARVFRDWRVQIVHARNCVASVYCASAMVTMSADRPRLIMTFDTYPGVGTTKARLAVRWAASRASTVTAVSEDLSGRLVRTGWVHSCETIWNAVDTDEFSPQGPVGGWRERLGISDQTLLVGSVARIDDNKRHVDLLKAITKVREYYPAVCLVIAGDGPKRGELKRLCASTKGVHLVGRIVDVPAFLRELDVFVLSSADEGASLALLEAMSCELAIVATKVGGNPHILHRCGLLVPPRRPDLIAGCLRQLCKSAEDRRRMGRLARKRCLEAFRIQRLWQQYLKIYEDGYPLDSGSPNG
jgi:glycosyltransferase involved in cell wall biosynthesis